MRQGLGLGLGKGFLNLTAKDPITHSNNARGIKVNLQRYSGKWYTQGTIPTSFTANIKGQSAEYKLKGDKVSVLNKGYVDGKVVSSIKGTAESVSDNNRALLVDFGFPIPKGDYIIEYLAKDYSQVIVGSPDKDYLWIMTRNKDISESEYKRLLDIAKDKGYKKTEIKRIDSTNYGIGKQNRKIGVIYANKDEKGNTLTYSVLHRLSNGEVIEMERNTRKELIPFMKKYENI